MNDLLVVPLCGACAALGAWIAGWQQARRIALLASRVARVRVKAAGAPASMTAPPSEPAPPSRDAEPLAALHAEIEVLAAELGRRERARQQSDDLLRLVVEQAPSAMVFLGADGKILLANGQARDIFFDGVDLVGKNFLAMMARAPEALKRAMVGEGDELISVDDVDGEARTLHLAKRHVPYEGGTAVLVAMHDLTRELGRREVEVWKQVIRVIAHEVNNSLAPMSTLASTGRVVARGSPEEPRLMKIFDTVTERAAHLATFLEGYARLAKLPTPNKTDVPLGPLGGRIGELWPGLRVEGDTDGTGYFDAAQIEQLLVNLVKNATEAGAAPEDISLSFELKDPRVVRLVVRDRGHGMPPDVMKRALLPLFSTKAGGGGIGLALCREIAEAHGGSLRLQARDGGGLEVVVKLPQASAAELPLTTSLLLTRGA
jgi:two-component system nitrogen regulation sensor histidine kinase NtrY